jgi:cell division protein FtsQ
MRPEKKQSRSSRRLLILLLFFFFVVLFILFFQSSISRIAEIKVQGNELASSEEIEQASGLMVGGHFFGFRSDVVLERIEAIPAVQTARMIKKFPGLIIIEVDEHPRVAFQYNTSGQLEAVLANGYAVPLPSGVIVDKPVLTGWENDNEWRSKLCQTLVAIPESKLSFLSEIRPSSSTSYPDKIKIYTRSHFEVYTTVTYLPDKMEILYALIDEMKQKGVQSGVFELLEVDVHRSFELFYQLSDEATQGL